MKGTGFRRLVKFGGSSGLAIVLTVVFILTSAPAQGIDLAKGKKFTLNLDTTLSWGARHRVEDRDLSLIGLPEGGSAYSVNGDDGNLNFGTGIASNALKATVELDFAHKNFGFFVRGFGFYDFEIEDEARARTMLPQPTLDRVGSRSEFLDYFAWFKFNLGNAPGEIRVGNQVVSWGESTFIQGGINVINPIDVSSLRVPGAELREALVPQGMVFASISPTTALTLEGFYQYEWRSVKIDPPGTYFSTNDFAGVDGNHVFIGFGDAADTGEFPFFIQPTPNRPFMAAARINPDTLPDDDGQWGAAMRLFLPGFGNTEFGLYYINYHSRLPCVNGVAGTLQGALAAQGAGAAAAAAIYQFFGVPPGVSPEVDAAAAQAGTVAATDAFVGTAGYFISYPEDITLYGLSWNTQLGKSGIAFQGEVAFRQDQPFLMDDVELLFAALSPISAGLAATNQVRPGGAQFGEVMPGFIRLDSTQAQFTMTKVFGPGMGADQSVLLFEGAYQKVSDFPDQSVIRMEGPGTYTSGNPIHTMPGGAHAGKEYERPEHFASEDSWGYRLVGRLDYFNAFGAWKLSPRFAWAHDVDGVSPGPGGNFIEGRTALTLGINASYQATWQVDLSWTSYGGAGRWNLINDRDFVAANVKFSF